jgi:CubicO group peptidase (beta-lactamase class C family)
MPTNVKRNTASMITRALVANRFSLFLFFLGLVLLSCERKIEHEPIPEVIIEADSMPKFDASSAAQIDDYFQELYAHRHFNGVALFASNDAIHTLALGYKNMESKDSLAVNDQFQLASVSKPFTSFGILLLVQKGLIQLQDPVSKYLNCTPYDNVTIEQLLTHTSGIGYYAYVTDGLWGQPECLMSNGDLLTMMECEEIPLYFEPGRAFDYCNTNYVLLADIIEEVSGKLFQQYMKEEVFEKMGMSSSEIIDAFSKNPSEYSVLGHYPNGDAKSISYLDGIVGDKGMYSSVFDLYKFYTESKKGTLLSDSLWNEAKSPRAKYSSRGFYGYGFRIQPMPQENDTLIYHNGWWRGFRTYFWMLKNNNKCAIILTNSIRGGYLSKEEIWSLF